MNTSRSLHDPSQLAYAAPPSLPVVRSLLFSKATSQKKMTLSTALRRSTAMVALVVCCSPPAPTRFGAAAAAAAVSPSSAYLPLLFTDNALFESTHGGMSLRVQAPAVGPVVIAADKPWESWASKASPPTPSLCNSKHKHRRKQVRLTAATHAIYTILI